MLNHGQRMVSVSTCQVKPASPIVRPGIESVCPAIELRIHGVESSAPGVYALPPTPFYFGGVDRLGPFNSVTVDVENIRKYSGHGPIVGPNGKGRHCLCVPDTDCVFGIRRQFECVTPYGSNARGMRRAFESCGIVAALRWMGKIQLDVYWLAKEVQVIAR